MALHAMRKARGCRSVIRALHKGPEVAPTSQVTEAEPFYAALFPEFLLITPLLPPFIFSGFLGRVPRCLSLTVHGESGKVAKRRNDVKLPF